jgi:O-antigen/teichoic acid export membrane protein
MRITNLSPTLKKPLCYAIGLFATKGIALLMLPILANELSVQAIGRLELLTSLAVFLSLMVGLSLHEALYRYAGQEQSEPQKFRIASRIVSLALFVAGIALTALTSIIVLLPPTLTYFRPEELLLMITGVSIEGLLSLMLAWLRMQDKAAVFVTVTVTTCIVQVSLVFLSLSLELGVSGILLASVVAHLFELIWLQSLCRMQLIRPRSGQVKTLLRYSIPISLSGLVAFALNGAERWFIAGTDQIENLARYAIAAKFALAMCILVQPFGMWWMPKRFAVLNHQGPAQAAKYTQYGLIWIAILTALMAYFAPLFITLTLPESYRLSAQMVLFCLCAAMLKEITELTNLGLLAEQKTATLFKTNLLAAIAGLALALSLQSFSIWGILSALIGAQLIRLGCITWASQRQVRLPYRLGPLLWVYLLSFSHLLVSSFITGWHYQVLMCGVAPLSILAVAVMSGLLRPGMIQSKTSPHMPDTAQERVPSS